MLPCGADIVDICLGERGPCSDIKIWRSRKHIFSEKQEFAGDKAYVGEPQINTPHRNHKTSWKNVLNNLRLMVKPMVILWLIEPWLEIFPNFNLLRGLHQLIHQMNQFQPYFPDG